jgi:hypothetical protein
LKTDKEKIIAALESFYTCKHVWEASIPDLNNARMEDEISDEEFQSIFMKGYMKIFSEFCSKSAEPRGYHWSKLDPYNPEKLQVLRANVDGEHGEIVVRGELDDIEHGFEMAMEDGKWKIKRRYMIAPDGEQVEKSI